MIFLHKKKDDIDHGFTGEFLTLKKGDQADVTDGFADVRPREMHRVVHWPASTQKEHAEQ